jgi:hypothetical protein
MAGRRGEALEAFWAEKATARETLNALRGVPKPTVPSSPSLPESSSESSESACPVGGQPPNAPATTATTTPGAKAASHRIVDTRPEGFVVLSGTSGRTYLVVPLGMGGATCTCEHGRASGALAVRCSHVRAVEAWVVKTNADKRAKAAGDSEREKCWMCDGSGEVTFQPVYESRRTREVVTEKPRTERCLHCGGLGYVPKEE